jgi:bifunctional UDP-N-acetylglucosamine pyrophosphorylase/glucosamine-1-phosphate N-acetyltransferase
MTSPGTSPTPDNPRVSVIVLAAGEGSRMKSNRPKPLHLICGRPMVMHVIHALSGVRPERTIVVVGHGADRVTPQGAGAGPRMGQRVVR